MRTVRRACRLLLILLAMTAPAFGQEVVDQWALSIIDVSTKTVSTVGGAAQILGPPNSTCEIEAYQGIEQDWRSWRPVEPDAGAEWIEVRFVTPVHAFAVDIHETNQPGAVTAVAVRHPDGSWQTVWTGEDTTRTCTGVLAVRFPSLAFPVADVRIELDTRRVPGFTQIDAVHLAGYRAEGAETLFETVTGVWVGWQDDAGPPAFASYTCGDVDNDGWPDVYGVFPFEIPNPLHLRHNEGNGTFRTRETRLDRTRISGTNAGYTLVDVDNDGDLDIFQPHGSSIRPAFGTDILLRNDAGRFVDVSRPAGMTDSLVTSNAMWFDYDRDGYLDLYAMRGTFNEDYDIQVSNDLYRNQGDGTFVRVTAQAGLDVDFQPPGSELEHLRGAAQAALGADLNDDGWPDLYVATFGAPNRLFFNQGDGTFREDTPSDMVHPAGDVGAAVGDIDNDGDLDVFQGSVGGDGLGVEASFPERSLMLLNLGDGQFVDVTEGVGLEALTTTSVVFGRFLDLDNDGDLDLVSAEPSLSFLNDGHGRFTEQSYLSGLPGAYAICDVAGDGFQDVWYEQALFRNRGNDNHWLRIDPVGMQSNRDGIGARLIATAGDLTQIRELTAGDGWFQDEAIAHFGLGQRDRVDRLEIRWPSGQVDVITDIPADQEIRVIEGQGVWHPAPRMVWTQPPPELLVYGATVRVAAQMRPALFERNADILSVIADLSTLGGPANVPLADLGDGVYGFDEEFTVSGDSPLRMVEVVVEQASMGRQLWSSLSRTITVDGDPFTAVVETRTTDAVPQQVALEPNYPNPFNSATVIAFSLPRPGHVELAVYDLAGQRVATLVSGPREVGGYRLTWDGRDDAGRSLASGTYLYRLRTGGEQRTGKMLLLR